MYTVPLSAYIYGTFVCTYPPYFCLHTYTVPLFAHTQPYFCWYKIFTLSRSPHTLRLYLMSSCIVPVFTHIHQTRLAYHCFHTVDSTTCNNHLSSHSWHAPTICLRIIDIDRRSVCILSTCTDRILSTCTDHMSANYRHARTSCLHTIDVHRLHVCLLSTCTDHLTAYNRYAPTTCLYTIDMQRPHVYTLSTRTFSES